MVSVESLDKMKLCVLEYSKPKAKNINYKKHKILSYVSMDEDNNALSNEDEQKFHKSDKVSILLDSSKDFYQNYYKEMYS